MDRCLVQRFVLPYYYWTSRLTPFPVFPMGSLQGCCGEQVPMVEPSLLRAVIPSCSGGSEGDQSSNHCLMAFPTGYHEEVARVQVCSPVHEGMPLKGLLKALAMGHLQSQRYLLPAVATNWLEKNFCIHSPKKKAKWWRKRDKWATLPLVAEAFGSVGFSGKGTEAMITCTINYASTDS